MGGSGDKTTMVLKVDLQCCSRYNKIKKILCKFPQIRDQVYDEKNNTVTITVVCCDPENLRDKLCHKGCGVITSIEIKEPPKIEPPKPPKPPPKPEPTPIEVTITTQCCGHTGGPCCQCYGRPVPPPPCYDYYVCYGPYGYGRGCHENAGCSIM